MKPNALQIHINRLATKADTYRLWAHMYYMRYDRIMMSDNLTNLDFLSASIYLADAQFNAESAARIEGYIIHLKRGGK